MRNLKLLIVICAFCFCTHGFGQFSLPGPISPPQSPAYSDFNFRCGNDSSDDIDELEIISKMFEASNLKSLELSSSSVPGKFLEVRVKYAGDLSSGLKLLGGKIAALAAFGTANQNYDQVVFNAKSIDKTIIYQVAKPTDVSDISINENIQGRLFLSEYSNRKRPVLRLDTQDKKYIEVFDEIAEMVLSLQFLREGKEVKQSSDMFVRIDSLQPAALSSLYVSLLSD